MGGFAAGGGISSALGTVANLYSSKMLMKYQYKLQRRLRQNAYQDTMGDMLRAGLNPILAYQRGPTGAGAVGLSASPNFGAIGEAIAGGAQADAAGTQAASAKALRKEQGVAATAAAEAATSAADLSRSQATGVRLENVIKAEKAAWAITEAGKTAIHGGMVGGGPIGTAAATALDMGLQSLKGPPRMMQNLEIYPTKETQKKLDASRTNRNRPPHRRR